MRLFLFAAAFVAACGSSPPRAPTEPALAARVDDVLEAAVREQRIVGGVVVIARDGKLVYHRAVGFANRERATPMREDSIFRFASMTKPIVAATALLLADRGVLRLDDPVMRYLPDFTPRAEDGTAPTITIRHLLTHTSGLSYGFFEPPTGPYHRAGVSDGLDLPGRTWADNQQRLVSVPLVATPGTRFRYSLAIDVLGEVLARAAGAPLPELVARHVTTPLALRDTGFAVADRARLVTPYANQPSGPPIAMTDGIGVPFGPGVVSFAPSRILDPTSYPSGGAGAVGTARDFLTFVEAVRTNAIGLRPETHAAAFRDQLAGADPSELGPGIRFGFLSSVIVDPAAAKSPVSPGTLLWGGAYGHTWWIDPANRISVVLMTNTAFEGMAGKLVTDLQAAVHAR